MSSPPLAVFGHPSPSPRSRSLTSPPLRSCHPLSFPPAPLGVPHGLDTSPSPQSRSVLPLQPCCPTGRPLWLLHGVVSPHSLAPLPPNHSYACPTASPPHPPSLAHPTQPCSPAVSLWLPPTASFAPNRASLPLHSSCSPHFPRVALFPFLNQATGNSPFPPPFPISKEDDMNQGRRGDRTEHLFPWGCPAASVRSCDVSAGLCLPVYAHLCSHWR